MNCSLCQVLLLPGRPGPRVGDQAPRGRQLPQFYQRILSFKYIDYLGTNLLPEKQKYLNSTVVNIVY